MTQGLGKLDLMQFLDFCGDKGLMNPQTASARKASAGSLLSILSEDEAADVTKLDLNQITQRFLNLKGNSFKPESVKVYKSRTESSIRDFVAYKKDPLSFKPALEQRATRNSEAKSKLPAVEKSGSTPSSQPNQTSFQTDGLIFPIPLRPDVTIKIAGIPSDLTQAEARKIANVVAALAESEEF